MVTLSNKLCAHMNQQVNVSNCIFQKMFHSKPTGCCSTSSVLTGYVTGSSQLLVPGRVTALENIPQGATSTIIEAEKIVGRPDVQQLSVEINQDGTIELDKKSQSSWCSNIHWIRAIRISDDCHSYNVQLRLHSSYHRPTNLMKCSEPPLLLLQVVKPIEAGQELLLWFSEDILAMLQVVFLTPANIQGQKKYVCHRCSALYESPNPLKLHMTLSCGKFSIMSFWQKLSDQMKINIFRDLHVQQSFKFKLSPEPQVFRQKNAMDLTLPTTTKTSDELYRPYREPSAFKPFKKEETRVSPTYPSALPIAFEPELQLHSPIYNDEAQIETLVSSLGKSRQGHICLYCGKCYSRKYGLKIHIRTHTGYKPLKCKFCSRPFGDPSNLNKHVRLHAEGDTPYKCDLCGKILVRRRDLKRHLKSRHMVDIHPRTDVQNSSNSEKDVENKDESSKDLS